MTDCAAFRVHALPWLLPALLITTVACEQPDELPDTSEFDPKDEIGQTDDDDSAGDDDDDDNTVPPDALVISLMVQPTEYSIDTESSFPLQAVATWDDHTVARVTPDEFVVADELVATVSEDGIVTATGLGQTTITASYQSVEAAPITVTVIEPGLMVVHVADRDTGEPLEGVELYLGSSAELDAFAVTDATGMGVLMGEFSGAETVTAKVGDYYRTSVCNVTTRNLRMALRSKLEASSGTAVGTCNWTDPGGAFDLQFGLAATATHDNPVVFDIATFMAEERTLDLLGFDVDLPANIAIGDVEEQFEAPGSAGTGAVYAMTGTFPAADIQQALDDEETSPINAIITLMQEGGYIVDYSLVTGIDIPDQDLVQVGDLVPFTQLDQQVGVVVPGHPLGFSADDVPVVFSLAELGDQGMVTIGLGAGEGGIVVLEAERTGPLEDITSRYVAVVEVDGVGLGNPRSSVISERIAPGGEVLFPEFLDLTVLTAPTEYGYSFEYQGDTQADLYFVELRGTAGTWDVWVRGGTEQFDLDDIDPWTGLAHADWHMTAMGLTDTCYEELIHDSGPGLDSVDTHINRQSHNRIQYNYAR